MRKEQSRGKNTGAESKHAINEAIRAKEVRLISEKGEQVGVVPIQDALSRAEEAGMDLVEVAPEAKPPVCKILDFGKLRYREQKKAAETRKKSASQTYKELRLRYNTDSHDLETKIKKAVKFLQAGDRVRFQLRFKGREVVYKELGFEMFDKLIGRLQDIAVVEERTPLVSNRMILTFAPVAAPTSK